MRKHYFFLAIISLFSFRANAQSDEVSDIDTVAVLIMDRMTSIIGGIDQCSFDIQSVYDINTEEFGQIKNSDKATMCFKGPDKLMANSNGDKGHRGFWYNGETFNYYSWDNNRYAQMNVSGNIIDVIDSISRTYGVEFPGIDVFYPSFTDDVIATCSKISFLGQTEVDSKTCFHIAGITPVMTWQLWIANDEYFLPVKLLIRYVHDEGSPEIEFHYGNWNLNAGLPDGMFYFSPPPKAEEIKLVKPN